jgi:hypothetical protein
MLVHLDPLVVIEEIIEARLLFVHGLRPRVVKAIDLEGIEDVREVGAHEDFILGEVLSY